MKRSISFLILFGGVLLVLAALIQSPKKEVYTLSDDKSVKLIVEDGMYEFQGSGEEFDWIVDQFGQQGEWELKEYFKGPDYTMYIRQDGVVVNKRENSLDLLANILRDCVVTFIKAK